MVEIPLDFSVSESLVSLFPRPMFILTLVLRCLTTSGYGTLLRNCYGTHAKNRKQKKTFHSQPPSKLHSMCKIFQLANT